MFFLASICPAKLTFWFPLERMIVRHYVLATLLRHFFYILFVWSWERVSTLTFYSAQSSLSTSKPLKNHKIMSAQSGYLKMVFLQHFPSFHLSKKLGSPLLPLGVHIFWGWHSPGSRMLFIILHQWKHNVLYLVGVGRVKKKKNERKRAWRHWNN